MIVIKFQGGLGNQMFQYSAALYLAIRYRTKLLFDLSFYSKQNDHSLTYRNFDLQIFKLPHEVISEKESLTFEKKSWPKQLFKVLGLPYKKVFNETNYFFDELFLTTHPPVLLNGYFQSEKYFATIRRQLHSAFTFPIQDLNENSQLLLNQITLCNAVGIHIRRGDYVAMQSVNEFHGVCSETYYLKAIQLMLSHTSVDKFFLFTDDPIWVKRHLLLDDRFILVSDGQQQSWVDMYLLSKCKHQIIANSSFSWWAAWLNTDIDKVVIAPKQWLQVAQYDYTHVVPDTWIKI